nr:DUF6531 domain-containing protein [Roseateles oligotrophus]
MNRELDARHNGTGIGERAFGASPGVLAAKPSNNSDDCPRSGNPVVLSSGEKYLSQQDFSASGLYGLSLQRTYRSVKGSGWMFGPRWLSGLEIRPLRITKTGCTIDPDWGCIPVSATVVDIDGVERVYRLNDSALL